MKPTHTVFAALALVIASQAWSAVSIMVKQMKIVGPIPN